MPYIDWSDPEGLIGLLVEYVADVRAEAVNDPERHLFLEKLFSDLESLQDQFNALPLEVVIETLREIGNTLGNDFENDPVADHLGSCIEELERIGGASAS